MLSANARDLILNWLLTNGTPTRPTAWYISLHTGDPGTTGANELTTAVDADYARQSVTFNAPSGGQAANSANQSWTADVAATTHDITHIGVWDALTNGNFILGGALAVPENRVASSTFVLAAGRGIGRLT